MVDNTQLTTFQRCPRQYHYLYNLELDPGGGLEAEFGVLCHTAIGQWYLGKECDLEALYHNSNVPSLVEAKVLTSRYFKPGVYSFKSFAAAVKGYVERFEDDLVNYHVEGVEEKHIAGEWLSKLDVRLRAKEAHVDTLPLKFKVYGVELKTSGRDTLLNTREIDRQFIGEQVTAKLDGLFVTLIQLGEKGHLYHRELVQTPQWLRDEWVKEVAFDVKQVEEARAAGVWPKRAPSACYAFNRECAFLDLCQNGAPAAIVEAWPKKNARGYLE